MKPEQWDKIVELARWEKKTYNVCIQDVFVDRVFYRTDVWSISAKDLLLPEFKHIAIETVNKILEDIPYLYDRFTIHLKELVELPSKYYLVQHYVYGVTIMLRATTEELYKALYKTIEDKESGYKK